MDIRCKKCECKYNNDSSCCARKIKIGCNVDCETYEFSEKNAENLKFQTEKNMFEISTISGHIAHKNTQIYCNANCLFNHLGICRANGISVLESDYGKKTPICATQIDE